MKLSVLICTIPERKEMFEKLTAHLKVNEGVEIIADDDPNVSIGTKRQMLLNSSKGEYVVFVDDDDEISDTYVSDLLQAIQFKPDVIGFKGWMFTNGRQKTEWIISNSLPYEKSVINDKIVYLRYPNHLSPIKRDIALQIGYPNLMHREDYDYATRLRQSGLIKTEYFIDKHLYTYHFRTNK